MTFYTLTKKIATFQFLFKFVHMCRYSFEVGIFLILHRKPYPQAQSCSASEEESYAWHFFTRQNSKFLIKSVDERKTRICLRHGSHNLQTEVTMGRPYCHDRQPMGKKGLLMATTSRQKENRQPSNQVDRRPKVDSRNPLGSKVAGPDGVASITCPAVDFVDQYFQRSM